MYAASAAKYVGVPSDRTTTRSLSSPCALVRAHTRAVPLVGLERRERLRDLRLDDALPLEAVEVDAEPLERRLDLPEHPRDGVALLAGEHRDVLAPVAVLRRLFSPPDGVDRRAEEVHLRAGVVVVVLALDVVPRELEQPRDGVAVRAVPRGGDGDRPGRVRRDELDLDALRGLGGAGAEAPPLLDDRRERASEPGVVHRDVQEPGACDVDGRDALERRHALRELRRHLARWPARAAREPKRDVGRVVAVPGVGRALERHGSTGEVAERAFERQDGVERRHRCIVRRGFGPP